MATPFQAGRMAVVLGKRELARVFSFAFQVRTYSAPAERSIPSAKQKYVPTSGVYPKGFLAGSAHAGVKASNTKYDDIALVVSEVPCVAAAVTTRNIFKAAPVLVSRKILREREDQGIQGVVVNSGCANAVTGQQGRDDALAMARTADQCFGDPDFNAPRTLVMSTGVIGQRLPIDKINTAIPKAHAELGSSHDHWMRAAQAICTTDTFPKLLTRTFSLPSHPETTYSIAGMTKGAGMIHPNMGTLLGIVCTDVKIHPTSMYKFLAATTNRSFNSISIDGDTSTNDTVAFFANGAAAPPHVQPLQKRRTTEYDRENPDRDVQTFYKVMGEFMTDLAQLVVRDGEGATKFVTVRVLSDVSLAVAKAAATSIAKSSLVKTALYGKDANWGRILCALGYTPGIIQDPGVYGLPTDIRRNIISQNRTSVSFTPADGSEPLRLLVRGEPEQVDEARAKEILEMEDLEILVRLEDDGPGAEAQPDQRRHESVVWTCDLSHEYVTINGDYRT